MSDINCIILTGYVGIEAERRGENGPVSFTLATRRVWFDKQDRKQDETTWHRVIAWAGLGQIAEKHIGKGDRIAVRGRQVNREWTDKEGNRQHASEVVAEEITFLGKSQKDKDDARNGNAGQ